MALQPQLNPITGQEGAPYLVRPEAPKINGQTIKMPKIFMGRRDEMPGRSGRHTHFSSSSEHPRSDYSDNGAVRHHTPSAPTASQIGMDAGVGNQQVPVALPRSHYSAGNVVNGGVQVPGPSSRPVPGPNRAKNMNYGNHQIPGEQRNRSTSGPGGHLANRPANLNVQVQPVSSRAAHQGPLSAGVNVNRRGPPMFRGPAGERNGHFSGGAGPGPNYRNSMFVDFNHPETRDFSGPPGSRAMRPVCGAEAARMKKSSSDKLPSYNEATKR